MGIANNSKVLTNIKTEEEFYILETYSILTKKEELKIAKNQLDDIYFNPNTLLSSHNLIVKHTRTNGIVTKKLYFSAEPWSELASKINQLKNYCQQKR